MGNKYEKMFQQCLFYYFGLKLFRGNIKCDLDEYDGPNPKHNDKLFVPIFDAILKRSWQAVQQMEAITFQLTSYANNEAQMNWVMSSLIIYFYMKPTSLPPPLDFKLFHLIRRHVLQIQTKSRYEEECR